MMGCRLTTYYDVRKTYPSVEEIGKLMEEHGTEERFAEELNILIGELFKVDWYRIVLDEVHIIKNHMSQSKSPLLLLSFINNNTPPPFYRLC